MKKLNRVIGIDLLVDSAFELLLGSPEHERVSLSHCRWHHCGVPRVEGCKMLTAAVGKHNLFPKRTGLVVIVAWNSSRWQLAASFVTLKTGTLMDRAATIRRSLEDCGPLVNRLTRSCSGSVY